MMGLAHRGFAIHDMRTHLIHALRPAGYRTVLIGEQHIAGRPADIGFDVLRTVDTLHHADDVAPAAAELLRDGLHAAVLPLRRLLRDAPALLRAVLAAATPTSARRRRNLPDTAGPRRDMAAFQASAARSSTAASGSSSTPSRAPGSTARRS